jgi:DNA-binding CsgD family transcriptional regulator
MRTAALVRGHDGLELARESVAVLQSSGSRLEEARALCEYGAALRRAGARRDAREPLRRAAHVAQGVGALALVERARTELVAAGGRPRRVALSGSDSLTPSERRVAALAATGRTNAEIAQALFLAVRTVEGHLTHVYRKLDVGSRAELESALAGATRPSDAG